MIYLYLFGTCFHFIYVFMIIGKDKTPLSLSLGAFRNTQVPTGQTEESSIIVSVFSEPDQQPFTLSL